MPRIKPFRGIRPPQALVAEVAARPYDVLNSEEARIEAGDNEKSLYHITKPEINFAPGISEYDERVYQSAHDNFQHFVEQGWFVQDEQEQYYLYAQTMNGKTQYGIIVCAHINDYNNGIIKKHELTRRDKEDDRMRHVQATNAHIGPAFLAYKHNEVLLALIDRVAKGQPEYDFVGKEDGFGHTLWLINDAEDIATITREFEKMDALYIADGHHRSAAAARVGLERAEANPNNTGNEEYNFYMAVCFPAEQLTVLDYNRVVTDLNGHTPAEFIQLLEKSFVVEAKGENTYRPAKPHEFGLYLEGQWYRLEARPDTFDPNDPIGDLDVDISSRLILQDLLAIGDLRSSKRIDFVGGLRGLEELKKRVDSGEMKAALALYPVSMEQVMRIADTGNIMPPKATWFEPKLRSGVVVHSLD